MFLKLSKNSTAWVQERCYILRVLKSIRSKSFKTLTFWEILEKQPLHDCIKKICFLTFLKKYMFLEKIKKRNVFPNFGKTECFCEFSENVFFLVFGEKRYFFRNSEKKKRNFCA